MFTSTMLAILAQQVCATGKEITWEQALLSTLSFALPKYGWDVADPTPLPGITKFL